MLWLPSAVLGMVRSRLGIIITALKIYWVTLFARHLAKCLTWIIPSDLILSCMWEEILSLCLCIHICRMLMLIQSCPTLCLPGSSIHGILQARILEWVSMSSTRVSSRPRKQTSVSWVSCVGRWILYHWAIREAHVYADLHINRLLISSFYFACTKVLFTDSNSHSWIVMR